MLKDIINFEMTLAHCELPKAAMCSRGCCALQPLPRVPSQYLPPFSQQWGHLQLAAVQVYTKPCWDFVRTSALEFALFVCLDLSMKTAL